MNNYLQSEKVIEVAAPYNVSSGGGCLVGGGIFGFANVTALSGALVPLVTQGVFTHAKNSAEAWTVGAKIYWDDTAKVLTTVSTSNTLVGNAVAAAANPSASGTVRLNGHI
jgi:predicted RecA/RadA family phage recombinase